MYKSLPGSVLLQLLWTGTGDALCVAEWDALELVGSGLLLEIPDQQAGGVYAPPGQDPGGVDGGGLYIMGKEKDARWLNEEIERLKLAPAINGCGMTPEWAEQMEIMETLRQALTTPNEPLIQADLDVMDYDKVWIDYGDDGEWALVVSGRIYALAVLEGAGFEEILQDEVGGETMDRPSGNYTVYRRPPEGEA